MSDVYFCNVENTWKQEPCKMFKRFITQSMLQENSMEVAEKLWKVSLAKGGIVDLHFSSVDNGK